MNKVYSIETDEEERCREFALPFSVAQPLRFEPRDKFQELRAQIRLIAATFVFDYNGSFESVYNKLLLNDTWSLEEIVSEHYQSIFIPLRVIRKRKNKLGTTTMLIARRTR